MRPITIQILQGSDIDLVVTPTIAGSLLEVITGAVFIIYKNDLIIVEKALGAGVSFSEGSIIIEINSEDTISSYGSHKYELLISVGTEKYFAGVGIFDVIQTKARIL